MKKKRPSELETCKKQLAQAQRRITELETELAQYLPKEEAHSIDGWNVQYSGGYFRLFKKIEGKLHGIYLGRKCDEDIAKKKIKRKMEELKSTK